MLACAPNVRTTALARDTHDTKQVDVGRRRCLRSRLPALRSLCG
ncbi:hypothetical protein OAN61_00995 [bacterium]|nr:hypothetical protein [bacterium]